jgi:ketosteroid isomerase-like protein
MSQENVEIVRSTYAAFNEQLFNEQAVEEIDLDPFFDPDVVVDNSFAVFDAAIYHGHDGVRELLALLREMWAEYRLEPEEFIPVGKDQVVLPQQIHTRGRDGVEASARNANIYTLRDGKITHVKAFQTKEEAFKAAGLSE